MLLNKGTLIEKCNSEPGDGHKDGDKGVVVDVLQVSPEDNAEIVKAAIKDGAKFTGEVHGMYCIEWDDMPGVPVYSLSYKVKER